MMSIYAGRERTKLSYKILSAFIAFTFSFTSVVPPSYAQSIASLNLPVPGTMVAPSAAFVPILLKGMTIHPDNPLQFDFIIDSGNTDFKEDQIKTESQRLVKYFLASMTIPKDDLWVNLSPYESDKIIPDELGKTELGRDMLAQDYILKQLTASLMYPEKELGKEFWNKVYQKAQEKYGTTEIPVDTFNKVWILPETATVYEHGQTVYIVEAKLRVMLDQDYVAGNVGAPLVGARDKAGTSPAPTDHNLSVSTEIIREIILPEIEREVNYGQNFAPLRQIYHSLILAKWYKETIKESLLSKIYVDQKKTAGVESGDATLKDQIYAQYMEAYKKGVFNYIKEDYDRLSNEMIPRKYFSGGLKGDVEIDRTASRRGIEESAVGKNYQLAMEVSPQKNGAAIPKKSSSPITPQEARAMIKGKLAPEHHHLINDIHVQLAMVYEGDFEVMYHAGPPESIEIVRGEKLDWSSPSDTPQSSSPLLTDDQKRERIVSGLVRRIAQRDQGDGFSQENLQAALRNGNALVLDTGVGKSPDELAAEVKRQVKARKFYLNSQKGIVVTIAGASGTGKSTVSQAIARQMGVVNIGVGLIYRALALIVLIQEKVAPTPENVAKALAGGNAEEILTNITLSNNADFSPAIFYKDQNLNADIERQRAEIERTLDADEWAKENLHAKIAEFWLQYIESEIRNGRDVVAEMRPKEAKRIKSEKLEVYLTNHVTERAKRRADDIIKQIGLEEAYEKYGQARGHEPMTALKKVSKNDQEKFERIHESIKRELRSHKAEIKILINELKTRKWSIKNFYDEINNRGWYKEFIVPLYREAQELASTLVLTKKAGLEAVVRLRSSQLIELSEFIRDDIGIPGPDFVPYLYRIQGTQDALGTDEWTQKTGGFIKRRIMQRDSRPGAATAKEIKYSPNQPYIPNRDHMRDSDIRQPEKVMMRYSMDDILGVPGLGKTVWIVTNPFSFGNPHIQIIDAEAGRQHVTLPFLRAGMELGAHMPGLTGIFNSEGANASQPHPHFQLWEKGETAIDHLAFGKEQSDIQLLYKTGKVHVGRFSGSKDYKLQFFVFETAGNDKESLDQLSITVQSFVEALKLRDIPHNLIFKGTRWFVVPRKPIVPNKFGQSFAGAELAGEIIVSSAELINTDHSVKGMSKEKYQALIRALNDPVTSIQEKEAAQTEVNSFVKQAFAHLGPDDINEAFTQRVNVDTTVSEELEQELSAIVKMAKLTSKQTGITQLQALIQEAAGEMQEKVRETNPVFSLVLARIAFFLSEDLAGKHSNLRDAIDHILERIEVGRALKESLTLNFNRYQLKAKMSILDQEWKRFRRLDLDKSISESIDGLNLSQEETRFLRFYFKALGKADAKYRDDLLRTKKKLKNLVRLSQNIGFTGAGLEVDAETGVLKGRDVEAVSLANHDLRVGELAYRIADSIYEKNEQSATLAEHIGLVHDYGSIPFRFFVKAGEMGKVLRAAGYVSESSHQGIVYREKAMNVLRLKEDGFPLDTDLEHDLKFFDIYNEAAVSQMSDEAKIALAAESIEGVVEDILFGVKFGLITFDDLKDRSLPAPIEQLASRNRKEVVERLDVDFDRFVLEISLSMIEKGWSVDQLIENARRMKDVSRKNLIVDKIYDDGNTEQLSRQAQEVNKIMMVVFNKLRGEVRREDEEKFGNENTDIHSAVYKLSKMSEGDVIQEYKKILDASSPLGDRKKEEGRGMIDDRRRTMEEGSVAAKDELGGIDMNAIDLERQGAGVDIQFDPAQLQDIIDAGIDGFAPVIINIVPLPSVLPLLGLDPANKEEGVG